MRSKLPSYLCCWVPGFPYFPLLIAPPNYDWLDITSTGPGECRWHMKCSARRTRSKCKWRIRTAEIVAIERGKAENCIETTAHQNQSSMCRKYPSLYLIEVGYRTRGNTRVRPVP